MASVLKLASLPSQLPAVPSADAAGDGSAAPPAAVPGVSIEPSEKARVETSVTLLFDVGSSSGVLEVDCILRLLSHAGGMPQHFQLVAACLELLSVSLGYRSAHEYLSVHVLPLCWHWFHSHGLSLKQLRELSALLDDEGTGDVVPQAPQQQPGAHSFLTRHAGILTAVLAPSAERLKSMDELQQVGAAHV